MKTRSRFFSHYCCRRAFVGLLTYLVVSGLSPVARAQINVDAGCTLADAITSANTNAAVGGCAAGVVGEDVIILNQSVDLTAIDNGTGADANGLPMIEEDLVITTPDSSTTRTIRRVAGSPDFRILEISSAGPVVTLERVNIEGGRLTGAAPTLFVPAPVLGGCIRMNAGALKVIDSVIMECYAIGGDSPTVAGANARGGAIYAASGSLTVKNSSMFFNSAWGGDALIKGHPGGDAKGAGIYATEATLKVVDSTITSNFAIGGDALSTTGGLAEGGGIALSLSDGTLIDSLVAANAAVGGVASHGGNGATQGGGVAAAYSSLVIARTNLDANVANAPERSSGVAGHAYGGGLHSRGGSLDLVLSTVNRNQALGGTSDDGGSNNGFARGGGLHLKDTTVLIKKSALEENTARGNAAKGGAIFEDNADPSVTPLAIRGSTLDANLAEATASNSHGGGLYQELAATTITRSTLSNNTADKGGAVSLDSDSAEFLPNVNQNNAIVLINVTVSGNVANIFGGGIYIVGMPDSPNLASASLYHTTMTNNANDSVYLKHVFTDPELIAANTIIAEQASGVDCAVDGGAVLTSLGGNVEAASDCGFADATDQQSVFNPGFGPLVDNGGGTLTHALFASSVAIDAANDPSCSGQAGSKDQRNFDRFIDGNGDGVAKCDSGAVEYQGP